MNLTNAFQRNTGLTFHPKRNGGGKKKKKNLTRSEFCPKLSRDQEIPVLSFSSALMCRAMEHHHLASSSISFRSSPYSLSTHGEKVEEIYIYTVDFFFGVSSRQRKKPRSIICFQYCYSNFHSKSLLFVNVLWLSNSVSSCPIRIWKPIIEDIKKRMKR